jgi:phosphatidylinositol glycan class B
VLHKLKITATVLFFITATVLHGQLWLYDDTLVSGWQNWSWSCHVNFSESDPVYAGTSALSVQAAAWGALSLYHSSLDSAEYGMLEFYIRGSEPGIQLWIYLDDSNSGQSSEVFLLNDPTFLADGTISTGEWKRAQILLSAIQDLPAQITRINFFNNTESSSATYYLDNIRLTDKSMLPPQLKSVRSQSEKQVALYFDQALDQDSLSGAVYRLSSTIDTNYLLPQSGPYEEYSQEEQRVTVSFPYSFQPGGSYKLTVFGVSNTFGVGMSSTATGHFSLGSALLTINVSSNVHRISPYIYGLAFGDSAAYLESAGITVNRSGGNARTKYNWQIGASNTGADWYYENMNAHGSSGQNTPVAFVRRNAAAGCATLYTLPMIQWVAKDTTSYSYSVGRYGAQDETDPWKPDAGNGLQGGSPILADPTDAYVPARPFRQTGDPTNCVYQDEFLQYLRSEFGTMTEDAIAFIAMDNESDIWRGTHMDVHPDPSTYDELLESFLTYASMTRSNLPRARITGPVSTGWWYYWNSDAGAEDKDDHAGQDFLPWFLEQVRAHDSNTGVRTLDVLDIHYYPTGIFNSNGDAETRDRRLRTTRSFWDPSYQDEGWIGSDQWATETQSNRNCVMLIPRFKQLIETCYPGTKLGVTEWNMGGENDISGALAVADVLGIFGRENLYLASYWASPEDTSYAYQAFKLYGNYDGYGSRFQPVSVAAESSDQNELSVYAAIAPSGKKLTVISINKNPTQDITARINLEGFAPNTTAQVYSISAATTAQIATNAPITNVSTSFLHTIPCYSAHLLVFTGPVLDRNTNGLPDPWETVFPVSDPQDDDDNDNVLNIDEYKAGTDPLDPDSVLDLRMTRTDHGLLLGVKSVPGQSYQLETLSPLTHAWISSNTVQGNSALLLWDITPSFPYTLYRISSPGAE